MPQQSLQKQDEPQPISTLKPRAIALAEQAKATKIADDITRAMAIEIRSQLKTCEKQIDAARLYHVKPLKEIIETRYEAPAREVKGIIAGGVTAINAEIARDHREQERKAEEARRAAELEQRRQREAAEQKAKEETEQRAREAQEKARQEAQEAGFTAAETEEYAAAVQQEEAAKPIEIVLSPTIVIPIVPPPKTVRSESGAKATVKKILDYEILNIESLARELPPAIEVKRSVVMGYGRLLESQKRLVLGEITIIGVRFFMRDSVTG